MAHFIFKLPPMNEKMSEAERIKSLENTIIDLVDTLNYVLSHIDCDNFTAALAEKLKEDKE